MKRGGRFGISATLAAAAVMAAGCSANGDGPLGNRSHAGGAAQTGAGGNGAGALGLGGNATYDPGDAGVSDGGNGCPHFSLDWTPKTPTVFVLVDRSNSMFTTIPNTQTTYWNEMRTATLAVMQGLTSDVRFGFGAFSGQGSTCPDLPNVPPGSGNYQQIADLYNGLGQSQYKDTPVILALNEAADFLWNDTADGGKYILLVTDSEFDYCNDPPVDCAPDSAIYHLQQLLLGHDDSGGTHPPIGTLVFGIGSATTAAISEKVLQGLANAGAGQPVAAFEDTSNLYYNCNGQAPWVADFNNTGKTAQAGATIVDYAPTGGNAPVYKPDPTDQNALTEALRTALAGVKSCTFDLSNSNITINTADSSLGDHASVAINGEAVPYDPTNGWHAPSDKQVQLEGTACAQWRTRDATQIDFNFPCETIIVH